jgi:hypothetical protein
MKSPNISSLGAVMEGVRSVSTLIDGNYVPARPLGFRSFPFRVKAAWLVFTGRADALIWPAGQ